MKIIAFANQKGGVGKTTTAVTLAHGLALKGRRTLLVDLDPQGHTAYSLGLEKASGLYRLICLDEPLRKIVVNARPNLDVLPGDKRSETVKRQITLSDFRESILADVLHAADYECVLIDMAPSLDVLHVNGLVASDWVVIPTRLDALAVDGVKEILLTMGEVGQRGHGFQGFSILPTFFRPHHPRNPGAIQGNHHRLWWARLAAHSAGYAGARSCGLWPNPLGICPAQPGRHRLPGKPPAHWRLSASA